MSTEKRARRRAATRAVRSLVVASSAFASARAADVDFRPELSFGVFHDGNVAVTGDATDQGDRVTSLALDLAVTRRTPESALAFSYAPSYAAYHHSDELSYFGQSTRLSYTNTGSRQATYSFDLSASRTERQGAQVSNPSQATTFVPRSKQTYADVRGRGEHTLRRSIVDWEVRVGLEDYSNPGGDVDTASGLEDSQHVGVFSAWRYTVTQKSSVGLRLDVSRFVYENRDPTDVESLGLVGEYTIDRFTTMSYAAGVSRTGTSAVSATDGVGGLEFQRTITEVSSLTAGVRRSVSPGSGLGGPTIDQGLYVGFSQAARRQGLSGSIVAGYWRREPTGSDPTTASTQTISTAERLQWSFNRYVAIEIGHAYYDQKSPDAPALDTQYNSYGFNLRWSILGRLEARR